MAGGRERDYWERQAGWYDLSMRVLGRPLPAMLDLASRSVRGCRRVLEVAAGTGLVTMALAGSAPAVTATDFAPAMVARLRQRVREAGLTSVTFAQADMGNLPFAPRSFDAVVAANVLHLVPALEHTLAELTRVLEPGGRLVAPTFCHAQTRTSRAVSRLLAVTGFPGRRRFTLDSLCAALAASGLRIERRQLLPGILPVGYVDGLCSDARA